MKTIFLAITLIISVVAAQAVFAQEKPVEKNVKKKIVKTDSTMECKKEKMNICPKSIGKEKKVCPEMKECCKDKKCCDKCTGEKCDGKCCAKCAECKKKCSAKCDSEKKMKCEKDSTMNCEKQKIKKEIKQKKTEVKMGKMK